MFFADKSFSYNVRKIGTFMQIIRSYMDIYDQILIIMPIQ
ncbi:hypothetical protein DK880_00733 [Candidatus Cardinium hertigii]|uniref:Uncharacterized protein n=1 Tax=Candidatus Cardinium hertigii TaxID=247481 RepID=A0A2Z3L912_9BACT|nr:hypothetical protein DK880_00733 [Candidatus Cardinium hertigii]